MKTTIVYRFALYALLALIPCVLNAQTPTPTPDRNRPVTVTQGFVDDAAKAFTLVVELRDALQKEQMASDASAVTKAALQAQITGLNELIAIKDRKETIYESLLVLRDKAFEQYERIIKIQADMIDRLTKQLNKGKSGFQKFINALKQIATFAAGVLLGKGLVSL